MRIVHRSWVPCLALAFSSVGFACATASNEVGGDAALGPATTPPNITFATDGGEGGRPIVIGGGMDSGLPSITITSDGGMSSLNPPGSGSGDATTGTDADATTSFDSSSPPPSGDGGVTPPTGDSGFHHHHDGGGTGTGTGTGTTSGSSTSTGTGGIPTTCSEADDTTGCCVGDTRYYCGSGGTVETQDCTTTGKVCGWSTTYEGYHCVAAPGGSDPDGTPIACGGSSSGTGTGTGTSTSVVPTTCTGADDGVGCCGPDGKNYYCNTPAGPVVAQACPTGTTCGWGTEGHQSFYGCVTGGAGQSDPSDTYPIACQ